jgi:hypothetical protein
VVYVVSRVDRERNRRVPSVWVVPADGNSAGGTPKRMSNLANGVSNCNWSPTGMRFACLTRTGPSDSLNTGPDRSDVRHYSHSNYKFNDTGWFDDKRTHLCVADRRAEAPRRESQLAALLVRQVPERKCECGGAGPGHSGTARDAVGPKGIITVALFASVRHQTGRYQG